MRHPPILRKTNEGPPKPDKNFCAGTYSEVVKAWNGATVAIIAGGPSVTAEAVKKIEDATIPTIAVNDAYLLAPWCELCYFCDFEWWGWHTEGVDRPTLGLSKDQVRERFAKFEGQKCSISNSGHGIKDPLVHILRNGGDWGLDLRQGWIKTGRNSGFMALNVAVLSGARKVILLGFDARREEGKPTHWFGEHPRKANSDAYNKYVESFRQAENALLCHGVKVINCTPGSRIPSFPIMSIEQALAAK